MTLAPCSSGAGISGFAYAKTASLLRHAADAINAAARSPDPEAIHDMRVAIRRFQQSIRLFRQFLRKKGVRTVRADLRSIMEPAGELRNLDVAVRLVRRAGGDPEPIGERRLTARLALQGHLSDMAELDLAARWLKELGIPSDENLET